jgi:glucose-1-phosphate adenylyltransferase
VRVNSYAEIEDAILLEGVEVGRHARIRKTIVDKEVQIPTGMEIGFHPEEDARRFTVNGSGIVVVPKGLKL